MQVSTAKVFVQKVLSRVKGRVEGGSSGGCRLSFRVTRYTHVTRPTIFVTKLAAAGTQDSILDMAGEHKSRDVSKI